jgi:hypothetical protein
MSVVKWSYIEDAVIAIVVVARGRAPLPGFKGEMRSYEGW